MALLAVAMALAGCASDQVPLEPGQARIKAYQEDKTDAHTGDIVRDVASFVPIPGVSIGGLLFGSAFKAVDPPAEYTEAVWVYSVDDKAVAITGEYLDVPAGLRSLVVRYCRYDDENSACSDPVKLSFTAEAGAAYKLMRNRNLRIEIRQEDGWETLAQSEKAAGVKRDQERCVSIRKNRVDRRWENGYLDEAEAERQKANAPKDCEAWIEGDGVRPY